MKKPLMILLSLIVCVLGGACATNELYRGSIKKRPLDENISSFLITNDQQKLVIIGRNHHYIFPLYNDLREILTWSGRSKIMATDLEFVISKDNKINGSYRLKPRDLVALSDADKVFMDEHYFKINEKDKNKGLVFSGRLTNGVVYDAGKFKMPSGQSFNQPYPLTISYDYVSKGEVAKRALLTPVAVAADGALIVGVVAVTPIFLLFAGLGGGLNVH